jgi:hypothetical protein
VAELAMNVQLNGRLPREFIGVDLWFGTLLSPQSEVIHAI